MGIKIKVVDGSNKGRDNYTVHVKWTDRAFSRGSTNSSGIYDTGRSNATVDTIEVFGKSAGYTQDGDVVTVVIK